MPESLQGVQGVKSLSWIAMAEFVMLLVMLEGEKRGERPFGDARPRLPYPRGSDLYARAGQGAASPSGWTERRVDPLMIWSPRH